MRTPILIATAVITISAAFYSAHGETPNTLSQPALDAIIDTATKICGDVPQTGENDGLKVTGSIEAALSGLAKKLASLGGSGTADYDSTKYVGVIQSQLPAALNDVRGCKLHIFDALKDTIYLKPRSDNLASPAPVAAFTGKNIGPLEMTGNDLNGADQIANVENGQGVKLDQNQLNRSQSGAAPTTTSSPVSGTSSPEGFVLQGATAVGGDKLVDAENTKSAITIKNTRWERDESKFFSFPPATGEFGNLSPEELKAQTTTLAAELENYELSHQQQLNENPEKLFSETNEVFKKQYLPKTLSLSSEWMRRLKKVYVPDSPLNTRQMQDTKWGAIIILDGKLSGPFPMHCAANFLRYLTEPHGYIELGYKER